MYKTGDVVRCVNARSKYYNKTFLVVSFVTYHNDTYAALCDLTNSLSQHLTNQEILDNLISDVDVHVSLLENPVNFERVAE